MASRSRTSPSDSRSAARIVSDIATGRVHKDVAWPGGEPPTPKRAGGQHKNIPDYDPTDKRILELEAEIVHLTEERNRERQKVKAGAKIAGLFKAVVAEMEQRIKPFAAAAARPWSSAARPRSSSTCVMHLSDGHHDQVVRPEEVGGLEDYNFPISCCRAERYVDTVVEWMPRHAGPEVLLSGPVGLGLRRLHQRRNPQGVRAVLLPQPVQKLPRHRPACTP